MRGIISSDYDNSAETLMLTYIDKIYRNSPADNFKRAADKLARLLGTPTEPNRYDPNQILTSAKHMRGQRPYDYFQRYEAIAAKHLPYEPINFIDKRVIEIGAGPVLGWAPLALFLGAKEYVCIDPKFNVETIRDERFREKYLRSVYRDLSGVFDARFSFDELLQRIDRRVLVHTNLLLEVSLDGFYDVILSNSVLEHIHNLEESLSYLHKHLKPEGRFLHCVDFGNHRGTKNPFADMYCRSKAEYFDTFGDLINLLRAPDILKALNNSGAPAEMAPYYSAPEFFEDSIIPEWREQYSDDDLFLKCAVFVNRLKLH